jgi:ElaB/YqjD/DUF883 family membrane-anchored ribosome-binding protein
MLSGYGRIRAEGHMHTLKALEHDIDTLRADIKGLAKSIKGGTKERASDLAAWFKEATKDMKAKEKLSDAFSTVKYSSKRAAWKTKSEIKARPFVSIMAALAVGVTIAMLVRRSRA